MMLRELAEHGAFSALDIELARTLCRLAGEPSAELALAVALASREVQSGHVCADLRHFAARPLSEDDRDSSLRFPELGPWLEQLTRSPLISSGGPDEPARPLVLDDRQRLYLARYYDHERAVAAQLRQLAEPLHEATREADATLVERLFPALGEQPDRQRAAALATRQRRLSIIVGGPGTGKTSTVVKLLALLVDDALAAGRAPPGTLLVAPTGKAAQRLTESIDSALDRLPVDDGLKRAIATSLRSRAEDPRASTASTLHRALGPLDGSLTRFRHGRARPLDCDLVLLDEASMVDLALMRRFFDAVPAHARVILLGDPDQLASVEAGGVLYDLCRAAEQADSPLSGCVSRLTASYRYPADSGIAALARAVHQQSFGEALHVLKQGLPDVALYPALKPRELGRSLEREAREHYKGLREASLDARLGALDCFRVLCAHRTGPASVQQLNPLLSRALGQSSPARFDSRGASYAGRPIIITQNDYATQLFNGDVGVIHSFVEASGSSARERSMERHRRRELLACFRSGDSTRQVSLARLPSHDSAYAMTVHKSQGSEFERVAIVLPERPSRILSRELLYTAITRAKRGVSLYTSEASLRAAITQRVERSSGLVDRLLSSHAELRRSR